MAPRALGALFALVAALCFATALAGGVVPKIVPGWWDGHPSVDGKVFERKDIHVGLLGAHGCNLGETVTCQELSTGGKLDIVGLVELAALGLIVVTGMFLARSVWKMGDRRKLLGKLVLIEVVVVAAGGGVILALGPDLKVSQHVDVPIGIGFYVFFTGVATAGLAGILAIRVEPEPLRLKSSHTQLPAMHPPPQFDVREVLRESHQDFRPVMPPSPGGALPGPAGHLGVHQSSPPLFDNAPQLRPLYDVQNAVPAPTQPQLPVRGPTPIARAAVGAEYGIPTPPPIDPPQNATGPMQPMTGPQSNNATGPHVPTGSQPGPRAPVGSQPGARPKSPSVPPPPASRGKPSVPPPNRGAPMKHPTLTHAIPPPPTTANMPPPTTLPARDSSVSIPALADGPRTNVHDAMDPITGVEIDAEAKAAALAMGDRTDRTAAAPHRTPPPGGLDPGRASASDLNATLARDRVSASSIDQTLARDNAKFDPNATIERPRGSSSDLNATIERPRESLSEINATVPRPRQSGTSLNDPPTTTGDGPTLGGTPSAKREEVGVATEHRAQKPVEVPITTAPPSLPPPKKVVSTSSGPTPACPQCEAPMAWVEEHLRFYCASCRMYF